MNTLVCVIKIDKLKKLKVGGAKCQVGNTCCWHKNLVYLPRHPGRYCLLCFLPQFKYGLSGQGNIWNRTDVVERDH